MFGLPTEDDGSRDDVLLGQNLSSCTHYEPDVDALRAASTRIVVAAGAESEGELARRGAVAVAERLGTTPAVFPGGHGGFLGGEYGQNGQPEAFAARLREVLAGQAKRPPHSKCADPVDEEVDFPVERPPAPVHQGPMGALRPARGVVLRQPPDRGQGRPGPRRAPPPYRGDGPAAPER